MPKFYVTATRMVYYRGIIEAESRDAVYVMDSEDLDLVEYDSEGMDVQTIEEVK